MKRRIAAAVQIVIVLAIIVYGTCNLYLGNFEQSIATLPFLIVYYLFLVARQRRSRHGETDDDDESKGGAAGR